MRPLVYVMGPSGAGKDAVMREARASLRPNERFVFAHRYITRPADSSHENFVSLTDVEFVTRRDGGLFAFHWRAHGVHYAIGIEIDAWRRAGFAVVVSGSRAHFKSLSPQPSATVPVLINAPPDVLARRLATRGRESAAAIAARMERNAALTIEDPTIAVVDNSGALADGAAHFLAFLRRVAATA